jgi:aminocarboxymuconate-semialdehyde decarboxylase
MPGRIDHAAMPSVMDDNRDDDDSMDRRAFLFATGTAITMGVNVAASSQTKAQTASSRTRIDAHTHFGPLKFIDFAEKAEGRPFVLKSIYAGRPTLTDAQARLNQLDQNNVDLNVLVPIPWIEVFPKVYADRSLAAQAASMMNDELAEVVVRHPDRFRGVAILPTVDPEIMITELNRAVRQLGFVGAYVAVGPTAKRMDHPDYDHLYKALVELDATLWLHPSRPPIVADYADEKLSQFYDWQLVGWPHDTTSAMFRIVFSGVFDHYPQLRIVTHHAGGFVPLLAPRFANIWPDFEAEHPLPTKISRPLIDHFRKFYCDTALSGFSPKGLELAVEFFGADRVLFGTDAPFGVNAGRTFISETLRSISAMTVSPETRTAILSNNAKRILRLS